MCHGATPPRDVAVPAAKRVQGKMTLFSAGSGNSWRRLVAAFALLLGAAPGAMAAKGVLSPGAQCTQAIQVAAQGSGVPNALMAAIGMVETGRQDPSTGGWSPWPWSINAEGRGMLFGSKAEAIAAVRAMQADGVRSIDVGCMQVNLMHHPDAFATLEDAFDPRRNAHYAGLFLSQLYRRSGDWMVAAGWYHSTTSTLAAEYVRKVTAMMPNRGILIPGLRTGSRVTVVLQDLAPQVGRDGIIVPSMRLTESGLVPLNGAPRPTTRLIQSSNRYGG
jgi:hypothetical protein